MPYLRRPDARIYYEVDDFTDPWRKPETLFFHHGHARSSRFWYPWVPLLARRYRIVRIDARGFGRSTVPPPDYPWTPDVFIEDARALMDHLKVDRTVWISEFLGNIVGLAFALKYPDRLKALVQCHPICSHADVHDLPHTGGEDSGELRRSIETEGMRVWSHKTIWQRLDVEHSPKGLVKWVEGQVAKASPATVMALRPRVGKWTQAVTDRLSDINTPTLLLLAEKSRSSTPYQVEYMARVMPRAKLVTLPGIGNGMWLLKPEWCVRQMRQFLAGITRESARTRRRAP
ncbi:MAG: alpha/beta hydrolase [Dehalococcoidia bacterium]|nr:alpha/beta hydrolase [Dehalococcoidia bacterium]